MMTVNEKDSNVILRYKANMGIGMLVQTSLRDMPNYATPGTIGFLCQGRPPTLTQGSKS
jgi:hypothetical protein